MNKNKFFGGGKTKTLRLNKLKQRNNFLKQRNNFLTLRNIYLSNENFFCFANKVRGREGVAVVFLKFYL